MRPFLKWAGGKRWLVTKHDDWLKGPYNHFIEPFLGSGTVFFHARPDRAILNDLNRDLIETYEVVRDDPAGMMRHLRAHQKRHSIDYYYNVRERQPKTPRARAARFIYLNRTCFNGIYRVNLNGTFNVPKGSKDLVIYPEDDFLATSTLLKRTSLTASDFGEAIRRGGEGDFIYIDPPYTVKHNNNNFIKYNERIFSWADQKRLAQEARDAVARGSRVFVSNADHQCIKELYSSSVWTKISVNRWSKIASGSQYRKITTELVITNFLDASGNHVNQRS